MSNRGDDYDPILDSEEKDVDVADEKDINEDDDLFPEDDASFMDEDIYTFGESSEDSSEDY